MSIVHTTPFAIYGNESSENAGHRFPRVNGERSGVWVQSTGNRGIDFMNAHLVP